MTPERFRAASYLEWNAARRPHAAAVWDGGEEITFQELLGDVGWLANWLRGRGVQSGDVVGVRLPNVWQYVALELAIPELGAVVLPLPVGLGEHEMRWVTDKARPRLVIDKAIDHGPSTLIAFASVPDPEHIVEIALTSGTTGMPKLAALSARLKQVTFEAFTSRLGITENDRVLPMTPLTQGIGGMCLYCLRRGATLVMLREPRWSAEHCLDVARRSAATVLVGVPTNIIRMLNVPIDLPDVRAVAVAGAPLPPEIAERWETTTGIPISSFYGSMDAGQLAVASPTDPPRKRWTTVGRPHDVAEWRITEQGEICMRGDLVVQRYWGEDSGPFAGDGWAHMGDLGFVDDDGYLHVVGRLKDIIIRGGSNINPYEVESILRSHPAIADACVVGRPDAELGEVPVAFVVGRVSKEEIDSLLEAEGLAHYKRPVAVIALDELPLSGPGKVNRKALREHASAV
jgi:acyl-CoA synthetase (AMP-forming)/AMP-acid ligase II